MSPEPLLFWIFASMCVVGGLMALGLSGLLLAALTVVFALAYPSFRRIA